MTKQRKRRKKLMLTSKEACVDEKVETEITKHNQSNEKAMQKMRPNLRSVVLRLTRC
jgi:hypothetical protein